MQPLERTSQGIFSALTAGLHFSSHKANSDLTGEVSCICNTVKALEADLCCNTTASKHEPRKSMLMQPVCCSSYVQGFQKLGRKQKEACVDQWCAICSHPAHALVSFAGTYAIQQSTGLLVDLPEISILACAVNEATDARASLEMVEDASDDEHAGPDMVAGISNDPFEVCSSDWSSCMQNLLFYRNGLSAYKSSMASA